MPDKILYRNRHNRMIWGVCGGIARYFEVDPTLIRIIAVVLLCLAPVSIPIYIICAIIIPLEPRE